MNNRSPYEIASSLIEAFKRIPILSTHEHMRAEQTAIDAVCSGKSDVLTLFTVHYTLSDMISAGALPSDMNILGDTSEVFSTRHALFCKFARRCANTTQMRSLINGLRSLYGGDIFKENDAVGMNENLRKEHSPGVYKRILQEKGNIRKLLRDCGDDFVEPQYFDNAVRMEEWLGVSSSKALRQLEANFDCTLTSFSRFMNTFLGQAEEYISRGVIAFKNAMLYFRDPEVNYFTRHEAEKSFHELFSADIADWIEPSRQWDQRFKPLQDYMINELCSFLEYSHIPLQIHTGVPEGCHLDAARGNPFKFLELVKRFSKLKIHLMHLGHPFEREISIIGKSFSNVYIDCSWMHILNSTAACFYFNYLLDETPQWKILGFGGDYGHMEGTFAHLLTACENISHALSVRVARGSCSESEAIAIARQVLYGNPARELFYRDPEISQDF